MRRGYAGLLVAVLAITAFVNPTAGPPRTGPSQSAPELGAQKTARAVSQQQKKRLNASGHPPLLNGYCQSNSEECTAKDLLDTIQGFFGTSSSEPDLIKHWNVPSRDRAGIRFAIATVPDPVHTRLPLFFDRQIDVIEEAAQEDGYLFARASIPWDTKNHAEDTDYHLRLEQQDYRDLKESHPGLMIFRKVPRPANSTSSGKSAEQANGPKPEVEVARESLFVFVVGETPTGGINKEQFNEAIRGIRDICSPKEQCSAYPATQRLFILGPTFSGSLYSLKQLLLDAEKESSGFSQAIVHSGTASDFDTIQRFEDSFRAPDGKQPAVIFRAFQESSKYALVNFLRMTCEEKYRPDQVAVLSEDETAYGNAYMPLEPQPPSDACLQTGKTKCQEPTKYSDADCIDITKVVRLYFPRNISQLRTAYQQSLSAQGSSSGGEKNPERTTLQTNLDENGSDDDTVAPYSQIQTPLSQEAIMLGIDSSLQRHGTRFVILEATNPVDALFLIRFLRSTNLQARIVTVGSDLLLTRQLDDPLLGGTMQIAPYPLIPFIDDSTAKSQASRSKSQLHKHLVFPDTYSVGSFNALLSLLTVQDLNQPIQSACGLPNSRSQCIDLPPSNYAEYGWPSSAGRPPTSNADNLPLNELAPPLWLTVLGRDGYWPVSILNAAGSTSGEPNPPTPQQLIHAVSGTAISLKCFTLNPPQGWTLLCSVSIALLISYAIMLICGSIRSTSKFLVKFAPICDHWRNFIFFAAGALLCLTMVAELWPWAYWTTGFGHVPFAWFVAGVSLFGILIVSVELWVRGAKLLARTMAIVCLSAFAGIFLAADFLRQDPHPFLNLMLYRYVNVSSGTSPIVPFLLLVGAALWWIWYWLTSRTLWLNERFGYGPQLPTWRQVVLDADEDERLPRGRAISLDNSGLVTRQTLDAFTLERNERLMNLIRKSTLDLRVLFPPFIAVVLSLAVVFPHPIQSFEGKVFDRLYWFCLTAALFGLLWALSKLIVIWLELRSLLVALDRLPLRRAFARMKGFTWKPLWGLGASALQDFFVNVSRQLEALVRVKNTNVVDKGLSKGITDSDEAVRKLLQWMYHRHGMHGATKAEVNNDPISRFRSTYVRLRHRFGANDSLESTAELVEQLAMLQSRLASVAAGALRYLQLEWAKESKDIEFEGKDLQGRELRTEARKLSPTTRYTEDFLCLFYFNFISSVFACMRTLVMRIAGIFVLVLLSFSSYPFEPRRSFHTLMIVLFVVIGTVVSFVFAQMHKDSTLSRITDTTPGDLGLDFWVRLAAFVSVPLFSLLATAFPAIGTFLFSWMQPATQAFR